MANANPSGPGRIGRPSKESKAKAKPAKAKRGMPTGIVRRKDGILIKRSTRETPAGPITVEVAVFEDDYKEESE